MVTETLIISLRIVLYQAEVYRLPRSCHVVRITSGAAWVTHAGNDIILRAGETAQLGVDKNPAVASALGETPLIMELLARYTERPSRPRGIAGTARIADVAR